MSRGLLVRLVPRPGLNFCCQGVRSERLLEPPDWLLGAAAAGLWLLLGVEGAEGAEEAPEGRFWGLWGRLGALDPCEGG